MFSFMDTVDAMDFANVCSSVVPGLLYVSGYKPANDLSVLQELSIRHVIRLGDDSDLKLYVDHPDVVYHTVKIEDCVRSHMTNAILDDAIEFIRQSTTPVLIHCYAGVSRSVSVAMAYLIKEKGMNYQDAKRHVKEKRACASPNTTFLKDLHAFYMRLEREKTKNLIA